MIATRFITPTHVRVATKCSQKSRSLTKCHMKKGESPNPYELYDSTLKMMSSPATAPVVEEMKRTNEALEKIVCILEEYKLRKLDGLVKVEELVRKKE